MDYSTFAIGLVTSLISCVACVISVIHAKKPASIELQSTVDELVALVEKMMKEQRKVKMSNVRSAVKDSADSPSNSGGDLGGLPSPRRQMSKEELRILARQKAGN